MLVCFDKITCARMYQRIAPRRWTDPKPENRASDKLNFVGREGPPITDPVCE